MKTTKNDLQRVKVWRLKNKDKVKEYNRLYWKKNSKKYSLANGYKGSAYDKEHRYRYYHRIDIYPKYLYRYMQCRVRTKKNYLDKKILFSLDDFISFIFKTNRYKEIYKHWARKGFPLSLSPSVDRIDNDGDYSLDNIQIITQSMNSSKQDLPVTLV